MAKSVLMLCLGALCQGAAAVALPPLRPGGALMPQLSMKNLAASYDKFSREQYLALACVQSGFLRGTSDAASQVMRGVEFDPSHSLAMGTIGLIFSGFVGASWLRHLEGRLGSGTSTADIVKKSAADFFCYAPCANSCYLFFVPLLTVLYSNGAVDVDAAMMALQHGFVAAMALELSMFAPYNLLSFRMIPADYRPQTTAAACAGYTIILSALC